MLVSNNHVELRKTRKSARVNTKDTHESIAVQDNQQGILSAKLWQHKNAYHLRALKINRLLSSIKLHKKKEAPQHE